MSNFRRIKDEEFTRRGASAYLGEPVTFSPATFTQFERETLRDATQLTGRGCYINEDHRYYTVEAPCNGYMIRESFKF